MDDKKFDPEEELRKLLPELHDKNGNFTLPASIESKPTNQGSDSWQYGVVGAPVGAIAGKIFSGDDVNEPDATRCTGHHPSAVGPGGRVDHV